MREQAEDSAEIAAGLAVHEQSCAVDGCRSVSDDRLCTKAISASHSACRDQLARPQSPQTKRTITSIGGAVKPGSSA